MDAPSIEQRGAEDHILFFKLYFLGRWQNYIEYMDGARLLAKWILPDEEHSTTVDSYVTRISSPIFCGVCFKQYSSKGSSFTISCDSCRGNSNMGYEIQQLGFILRTKWEVTVKLATIALAELMRDNNDISLMKGILYHE